MTGVDLGDWRRGAEEKQAGEGYPQIITMEFVASAVYEALTMCQTLDDLIRPSQ